jgi:hypothetical protein
MKTWTRTGSGKLDAMLQELKVLRSRSFFWPIVAHRERGYSRGFWRSSSATAERISVKRESFEENKR